MKAYRNWIYKASFWVFSQIAVNVGLLLSGDVLKIWSKGVEFDIEATEKPVDGYTGWYKATPEVK